MLEMIDGTEMFVVDIDDLDPDESFAPDEDWERPYADALNKSLRKGTITETGKYAVYVEPDTLDYYVYRITEK